MIHNAGVYLEDQRVATVDGHARVLAVNVLAPYMLTALMHRPARLIYLSSMMHTLGSPSLDDIEGMSLECVEQLLISKALRRAQGNVSNAAASLGLSRGALYRRMQRYGL